MNEKQMIKNILDNLHAEMLKNLNSDRRPQILSLLKELEPLDTSHISLKEKMKMSDLLLNVGIHLLRNGENFLKS